MLFNPRWRDAVVLPPLPWEWETPKQADTPPTTKPKTHTLRGLLAWLERRDPEQDYDYRSGVSCLLTQYFTSTFGKRVWVGPSYFQFLSELQDIGTIANVYPLPPLFNEVAMTTPWTFGAAADRCRDLIREGYE